MKSPHRRSRGRRVLAWTVVFFTLSQFVAGLLLDNVFPIVRFEEARHTLRRYRALCAADRTPDVVLMGSSRLECAISEDALTGTLRRATGDSRLLTFNAAMPAGDMETSDFVLERLFAANPKPRLLVLEVAPDTLNQHSGWINFQLMRFLRWQDFPRSAHQVVADGNPLDLMRARLIPLVTYRKHIADAIEEEFDEWRNGPRPADADSCPESIDWSAKFVVPAAYAPDFPERANVLGEYFKRGLRDYRVGGTALAAFERILERCRQQRIQVILLSTPVTSFHREFYSTEVREKYSAFLKHVETTRGIEFVDCESSLPDTLFADSHHANKSGAVCFAEKLGREILGPRVRRGLVSGLPASRSGEKR